MIFSRIVCTVVLLVGSLARADTEYASRPEVQTFVGELVTAEGFSRAELLDVFREAKFQQSIVDAISKPAEKVLTWKEYQDIFLTEKRVEEGARFMSEHGATLARAEQAFGVPAAIVAAIIGVETMYGRYRGNYRVIDALSTLAFDYPPRAKFFRGELKQFLLLAREEKQSATEAKGSYAGAMGYGQFIPSSYRAYAIDFDGDGLRDIWQNPTDAIGSVANYLAKHGWVEGGSGDDSGKGRISVRHGLEAGPAIRRSAPTRVGCRG
jgi:membrane-bound lytic murein transglycosylase B